MFSCYILGLRHASVLSKSVNKDMDSSDSSLLSPACENELSFLQTPVKDRKSNITPFDEPEPTESNPLEMSITEPRIQLKDPLELTHRHEPDEMSFTEPNIQFRKETSQLERSIPEIEVTRADVTYQPDSDPLGITLHVKSTDADQLALMEDADGDSDQTEMADIEPEEQMNASAQYDDEESAKQPIHVNQGEVAGNSGNPDNVVAETSIKCAESSLSEGAEAALDDTDPVPSHDLNNDSVEMEMTKANMVRVASMDTGDSNPLTPLKTNDSLFGDGSPIVSQTGSIRTTTDMEFTSALPRMSYSDNGLDPAELIQSSQAVSLEAAVEKACESVPNDAGQDLNNDSVEMEITRPNMCLTIPHADSNQDPFTPLQGNNSLFTASPMVSQAASDRSVADMDFTQVNPRRAGSDLKGADSDAESVHGTDPPIVSQAGSDDMEFTEVIPKRSDSDLKGIKSNDENASEQKNNSLMTDSLPIVYQAGSDRSVVDMEFTQGCPRRVDSDLKNYESNENTPLFTDSLPIVSQAGSDRSVVDMEFTEVIPRRFDSSEQKGTESQMEASGEENEQHDESGLQMLALSEHAEEPVAESIKYLAVDELTSTSGTGTYEFANEDYSLE